MTENSTDFPPKIAAAIVSVMANVPKLGRGETNSFAKYKFASIDAFLDAVRPLCVQAGLIVIQNEVSFEIVEHEKRWLKIVYEFILIHVDGERSDPIRRTIMVDAAMGAQGFGSAQSYALKQFLRSLFQIATGDGEDADFHPQALPIDDNQRHELQQLAEDVGADLQKFCAYLKVPSLSAIPASRFEQAKQALSAKRKAS